MAQNLDEIFGRQDQLSSVIEAQGDEPPTESGPSLISKIFQGLGAPVNLMAGSAINALSLFKDEEFPGLESDKSNYQKIKNSIKQNIGFADAIGYAAPEIDFLGSMGVSKEIQDTPIPVKRIAENVLNYMPFGVGPSLGSLKALKTGSKFDFGEDKGMTFRDFEEGSEKATRSVAGFATDVALDPLNLLVYGGKALKVGTELLQDGELVTRAGNKFLSEEGANAFRAFANKAGVENLGLLLDDPVAKASLFSLAKNSDGQYKNLESISKDAFNILEAARNPEKLAAISNANENALVRAMAGGETAGDDIFKMARAATEQDSIFNRMKNAALDIAWDPMQVVNREKEVRRALDLGEDVPISSLFSKETMRFAGQEIPGFSDGLKYMNDTLYNASTKASTATGKVLKAMENSKIPLVPRAAEVIDTLSKFPTNALSAVSRRVMGSGKLFGSSLPLQNVKEWQRAVAFNDAESFKAADELFKGFDVDTQKKVFNTFEEATKQHKLMSLKNPNLDMGTVEDMVARKLQKEDPNAYGLYHFMRREYDRMGAETVANGVDMGDIDDYLNRMYTLVPGEKDTRTAINGMGTPKEFFGKVISGKADDFSMKRQFELREQAAANGYDMTDDLRLLYGQRLAAHNATMANKKFMNNMFLQYGLSPEARNVVSQFAKEEIKGNAKNVGLIARQLGIEVNPSDLVNAPSAIVQSSNLPSVSHVFEKVDHVWGLPRTLDGSPISPELYGRLQSMASNIDYTKSILDEDSFKNLQSVIEKNQLTFSPEEASTYGELWKNYKDGTEKLALLGREGEFMKDRAGLQRLEGPFRGLLEKSLELTDPKTKAFFSGDLPAPIINLINDSLKTKTLYQSLAEKHKGEPWEKTMTAIANGFSNTLSAMRMGSIKIWPSYYIGNAVQAQIQGLQANIDLANNLNPKNLYDNRLIFEKGADMITDYGQRVTNKQIMREMKEQGINVSFSDAAEMSAGWAKFLNEGGIHVNPESLAERGASAMKPLADFSNTIENFGRQNLYVSLRKKGWTAQSAAQETSKAMIDYQFGKTNFEKSVLANLYFFYAFARGSASNAAVNLITKPGSMSAQASYVRMMTNLLKEEGAIAPEGFAENIAPNKASDGLSGYVGRDPATGNPRIISSYRTPLEETNRLFPMRLPSELSLGAIKDTAKENVSSLLKAQLSGMNPLFKGLLETTTNRNLYFDKPLNDPYLNQRVKPEAILQALSGQEPMKDTTYFDPKMKWVNTFLPPLSMANSKGKQLASSTDPFAGILGVITGMRTHTVDPERSGAFEKINKLKDYILNNYGVDVGNKKVETLLEDIANSKAGLNPQRIRREERAEKKKQKEANANNNKRKAS